MVKITFFYNKTYYNFIGDCSLISSFIILLNYEQKFNIFVISKYLVFPDCYNPAGKYAIRLFLDGKWCKVIIDDFLPISNFNSLLCSHTTTEGELYISLLEKAYLKVILEIIHIIFI